MRQGGVFDDDIAHTLRGEGFDASEDGGGKGTPLIAVAYGISSDAIDRSGDGSGGTAGERAGLGILEEISPALRAKGPNAIAFDCKAGGDTSFSIGDLPGALRGAGHGGGHSAVLTSAVRRLMPIECERLQGYDDDFTLIRFPLLSRSGKPLKRAKWAADGPRYKALGNSMAVPVMRWILSRIEHVDQLIARAA